MLHDNTVLKERWHYSFKDSSILQVSIESFQVTREEILKDLSINWVTFLLFKWLFKC